MFVYIALFIPFKISFIEEEIFALEIIDWIVNIFFFFDIIISLFTVYYQYGEPVDDL